ncbi:MAG TPA: hypothetical protein DCQ70_15850, partial [Halieaceae bacterium]|nr:hypothetical protein [Halieaceae bacterium]
FNGLMAMVALHLLAVAWHQWRLGEKLLQAMWRGRAEGREGREPAVALWRAVLLVAGVSGLFWWVLQQAPPPPRMW